ncbi:hypothetical protein B2G71_00155 [Novosphingobium sp. PC22D]|uniref:penicillin acylase family protein n=1 Tax=Novosphingobium sp. PC22D TaxID=1962403 RepID=UPI000BEFF037|nr:penicillin acylase family protein [Novosphingobium sp. PC22D]PEQ14081.1 hypothetical protein B2G71_00155 [Novosphingobium sp. PC22D]
METAYAVSGLHRCVTITVDRWGIAHIAAQNRDDLFFAQGYNAARDRLWQIDLWRKRGLGLLSAELGPGYVEQDRANRLFLYRGSMRDEWAAYGEGAHAIARAFAAGINAYIDQVADEPALLPPEFPFLAMQPQKWAAEDVVRIRTHGLIRNLRSKLLRAHMLARGLDAVDALRQKRTPKTPVRLDPGFPIEDVPLAALDLHALATAPVTFEKARLNARIDEIGRWRTPASAGGAEGSNNWAIGGAHTSTGRPILASDPHRAHAVPSLRYLVHLTAPGIDVIGAGEPAQPGIVIGHNGHLAFGLTIFTGLDQEELYCYPAEGESGYRHGGETRNITRIREEIAVAGHGSVPVDLEFTHHGPILHRGGGGPTLVAVRSVWSEPGSAPYFHATRLIGTRDIAGFRRELDGWSTPPVNFVCADIAGDIAWSPAGRAPIRKGFDGLLPLAGAPENEWGGFTALSARYGRTNPECGFIATANEANVGDDGEAPVGFEWTEPSRALRIDALLAGRTDHDIAASCAFQNDQTSLVAVRMRALIAQHTRRGAGADRALDLLRDWPGTMSADSAAAALFEIWWTRHLLPALLLQVSEDPSLFTCVSPLDPAAALDLLETPERGPWCDANFARTLADAWTEASERMGDDPARWAWGRLHGIAFAHPLAGLGFMPERKARRFGVGGTDSTIAAAGYGADGFSVTTGASVRMVIDVGNWDESRWINTPGQSGDPRSSHFDDLERPWADGAYVPMLYRQDAVDAAAERRFTLTPVPDAGLSRSTR